MYESKRKNDMEKYDHDELAMGTPTEVENSDQVMVSVPAIPFSFTTSEGLREERDD